MNMMPAPLYPNTSCTASTARFITAAGSPSTEALRRRCKLDRSASSSIWVPIEAA